MSPLPGFPWLKVGLNLLWIAGLAVILADFSYRKRMGRKKFSKAVLFGSCLATVGLLSALLYGTVSEKPLVIRIEDSVFIPLKSFSGGALLKGRNLIFSENGLVRSDKIQFEKGEYEIRIISMSKKVLDESANFHVYVGMYSIADFFAPESFQPQTFRFDCKRRERWRLRISFVNDYFYPPKNLNRNGFISEVEIIRVGKIGDSEE